MSRDLNRHEYAAREEKAHKIVATARHLGYTVAVMVAMSADIDWPELAHRAGVNVPSDETRTRVLALMAGLERADDRPIEELFDL